VIISFFCFKSSEDKTRKAAGRNSERARAASMDASALGRAKERKAWDIEGGGGGGAVEQESKEEEEVDDSSEQMWGEEGETHQFDGQELVTGLYMGSERCAIDHEGRRARGITHVLVAMAAFEMSFQADSEMVLSGNWKMLDRENRPLADMLNVLDDAVKFINNSLGNTGCVCIVSYEGRSRSAVVCLAYLMKTLGMTLRSAYDLMKSHQPEININRGFWRQLLVYEENIRGCVSIYEHELPGSVLFEKDDLERIFAKFRAKQNFRRQHSMELFHMMQRRQIENEVDSDDEYNDDREQDGASDEEGDPVVAPLAHLSTKDLLAVPQEIMSPTSATGISKIALESPRMVKRKSTDLLDPLGMVARDPKSPRNSIDETRHITALM
jgi:hypothetical protein